MTEFFNALISGARHALDLEAVEVYGAIPVDKNTLNSWESGKTLPRRNVEQNMKRLAQVLRLRYDEIMESIKYSEIERNSQGRAYTKHGRRLSDLKLDPQDWEIANQYRWYVNHDGNQYYAYTNVKGADGVMRTLKLHRLLMDAQPGELVDHINRDGLDNRRENLRLVTQGQNLMNTGKKDMGRPTASPYKGVHRYVRKARTSPSGTLLAGRECWTAQIRIGGKRKTLGYFQTDVEAAKAYDRAVVEHHDGFGYLNFPELEYKPCSSCQEVKEGSDFAKRGEGRASRCKGCERAYQRQRRTRSA